MAPPPPRPLRPFEERIARFLYGITGGVLTVNRTISAEAGQVLEGVGRTVVHPPYDLRLLDSRGGHPLDGGTLIFGYLRLIAAGASADSLNFRTRLAQVFIRTLELELRADDGVTEVQVQGDLDREVRLGVRGYLYAAVGVGVALGVGIAQLGGVFWPSMGVDPPSWVTPAAAGGGVALTLWGYRWFCRWAVDWARLGLTEMLTAVEQDVSSAPPP